MSNSTATNNSNKQEQQAAEWQATMKSSIESALCLQCGEQQRGEQQRGEQQCGKQRCGKQQHGKQQRPW